MRKILTLFGVLLCLCLVTTTAMAQNGQFDVRFAIKNYDCASNSVTIQVQVKAHDAAHTFLMGDANYRFDYDPRVIHTPVLLSQETFSNQAPASDFNYNAQNLNGSSAGLTLGTVSLNTIYGGGGNAAKLVPATWTTVSCIRFTVQDPTKCFDLIWHDDTRFPITGMNEIELLGGGTYGQYIVAPGGVFTNYSACIPQVCGGVTALNDINVTLKNTVVSGNLLTNDNSPYAMTATTTPFLNPTNGTLTISANGAYVYTPVAGYVGTDVAKYIVCNTAGLCDTASLFLNVLDVPVANVNSTPLAQNDNGVTYVGMSLTGNVLANDIDPEKHTLTVNTTPLSMPTNGTLVLNADGTYVYTPVAGFVGTDAFQYRVCDNGTPSLCSTATVTIEVLNNTTGGSVNLPPTANDDSYLTYKDTNVSGSLKSNDADPNTGQTLTYNTTPISNPTNGTVTINTDGTFTYVPTAGYLGPDAFRYAVCDNGSPSRCDTATAFVVMSTAPNQQPVVTVTPQNVPEDVSTTFCLPITDANALDAHTVTVCGVTGGGTATAVVNNVTHQVCVTYLSALNYNGAASVCLNVCDNGTPSKCDNVTVPITVTPVNDKPIIAIVNPLTTPEDVPMVFCATIADVDAGSTFTSTSCGAAHGTVGTVINAGQVCVTYTPTLDFNGLDSVCVIVCDNGNPTLCDTLRVRMTVTPVNDNPVIVDLTPQTTLEDTPLNVCTTINDVDGGSPVFSATLCGVTNGTATPSVSGNQLCLNFVPTLNYNGPATVCVIVCDNGSPSKCDTMNVAITVTPVNDQPVVTAVAPQTTLEDTPLTVCTTITDVDAGQTFTATPCGVTNGTLTTSIVGNQLCMTYTPNLNYNGPETICVNVCDNGSPSLCAQITVPITVTPVNDNPVIVDLTPQTTLEDTPLNVCTTINDVDVSSAFTATLCGVTNGTATPSVSGNQLCLNFVPTLNYNGPATVCVIVCDNGSPSKCDTMNVAITVTPVNDNPVITAVAPQTTLEDTPLTVCTTITDVDAGQTFTATPCGVTNGTLTTSVVGNQLCMTYTPNLNYNGPETICVNVCDNGSPSLCAQITVPITVTPVNDNPVIVDLTTQTTLEDTPLNVCTTINDVDVSSAFTATLCGVTNGTATPSVSGNQLCINYVPTLNYNGVATVCVIVCDNGSPSKCDTTTLTINVMPVNDKPVVTVVPITVNEDGTTTVCMPITDPDVGNTFTSTSCGAARGTVSTAIVAGQVCVTYTPAANYYGVDSACVIVCDNGSPSKCDTIKAPITVAPVNDAPVVPDGTATTLNSAPVTICVPIVDLDPLDTHTVTVCGAPTMGSISSVINSATRQLCVTYTPNLVAVGMDVVCLNVCDNGSPSKCDVTNLTFNIGSTNKPPVAMNDINNTLKNAPVSGNVLTNDSDPNSNALTVSTTPVQAPSNGTVVLNANGTYTYTPNPNFVGTDVFKYQVCDNGVPSMCTTATVTIEVREVLTAGTNQAPVATNDNTATPSGVTIVINVKANDFDPQGGTINNPTLVGTATGGTPSVNPDGTITFVPTLGFSGDAIFKYLICDNGTPALCDTATVNVTVYPNIAQGNVPPVANNDAFPVTRDVPFVGNVSTNDFDQNAGQTLTYTATTTPLNGTVTLLTNGQFSYVPATGFVGIDSFKYQVCDNNTPTATCATATAYFNVAPTAATPTNVAPVITNDVTTTYVNNAVNINVKANDYDPNGNQVLSSPAIVGVPTGGTAVVNPDGTITFTPNVGFTGTATITYQVCDNGVPSICANATVTVNVLPLPALANRPPTAINDAATTLVNTSINASAANNDSDPDVAQTLTYTRLTVPMNGISSMNAAGTYSYTPLSNFVGLDSFQYKICDNGNPSLCDTAWIVVNITSPIGATNVAPTANNDNTATSINTAVVINVKGNDYDLNVGQTLGLPTIIGTPSGGTASVNPDGTVTFTPTTGFTGVATFNYQVCDNGSPSMCKTATATIDVVSIVNYANVAPSATNDATTTPMNTAVAGNAKTNDFDFNNGQTLSYALATPAVNGSMVMQTSGAYVYTPNTGFVGLDSARYSVCDNASPALCSTAWIYVQVTATGVNTNATPIVLSDVASTTQSIPVTINVKGNDYDPNSGQTLGLPTITGVVPNGTATVNADGTITFTPTAGFVGTSTFSYIVCDNGSASLCVTASVTVTVLATPAPTNANMPPTAMDDAYQVLKGTSITGNLGLNDTDPNGGQTLTHSLLTNPTNGVMSLNANGTYSYTPNAGFTGTDQFLYKVCDNGTPTLCDTATVYITVYEFPCVTLTLKVLLEGPLNAGTGLMGTVLNQRGLLPGQTPIGQFAVVTPVGHPYKGAPWNSTDTTGQSFRNYPSNAVDWVLVSLRTSNSSSANVLRVPALLLNDGTVSFLNPCFSLPNGNYFVVIEHRNHMGIMSPSAVAVVNGVLAFDFTTGNSLTSISVNDPPAFGQKAVGTKWAMHAGDGKKTTQTTNFDINFNDSQLWKLESGVFDQYRYGDFNMNADVNFQDQVLWKNNNGRYSIVPH